MERVGREAHVAEGFVQFEVLAFPVVLEDHLSVTDGDNGVEIRRLVLLDGPCETVGEDAAAHDPVLWPATVNRANPAGRASGDRHDGTPAGYPFVFSTIE